MSASAMQGGHKQRVASYHTAEVIWIQNLPAPGNNDREQPISETEVGGISLPCLVWTSSP